jgi:hypothetical protein
MMLATTCSQRIRFIIDRHPLFRSSTTKPSNPADPTPPITVLDRVSPNQTHHPRRSNLHSACRTATRSPIAVSFLGGFRTPAAQVRGTDVNGRHPKPFTKPDVRAAAKAILFDHLVGEAEQRGRACTPRDVAAACITGILIKPRCKRPSRNACLPDRRWTRGDFGSGSGAAVPTVSTDRPLRPLLRAFRCAAANSGSVPILLQNSC